MNNMKTKHNKNKPFIVTLSRTYEVTKEDIENFKLSQYYEDIVQDKNAPERLLPDKDLAILFAYNLLEEDLDEGLISGTQDDFSAKII